MDDQQAAAQLRAHDQILILTHRRPDGDTIGCAVALCLGLRALGKTAFVLSNPDAHELFVPYLHPVIAPQDFTPTYVVTVDTASLELLTENAAPYFSRIDLSLDHHGSTLGYAKTFSVTPSFAACGALIYLLLKD